MKPRARKTPAGTKRTRASGAGDPKVAVLIAALAHVPFEGFADSVLARAADESGISRLELRRLFPQGPLSLVEAFSGWADAEMVRRLAGHDLSSLKVRERITLAVETRLAVLKPHKESARRAAAFLTLPPHASTGARLLYRSVDAMWRAVGDTSTDFNFYSKRAILAGVYSATLLRWFSDTTAGQTETSQFLRRRIDEVMKFEKFKAGIREKISTLPTLTDILNPGAARRSKAKGG